MIRGAGKVITKNAPGSFFRGGDDQMVMNSSKLPMTEIRNGFSTKSGLDRGSDLRSVKMGQSS